MLFLELLRFGCMHGRPLEHIPPEQTDAFEFEREVLLLTRTFSLLPATLYSAPWEGPLDHDLLGFNSIVKLLHRALRNVLESELAARVLRREFYAPPQCRRYFFFLFSVLFFFLSLLVPFLFLCCTCDEISLCTNDSKIILNIVQIVVPFSARAARTTVAVCSRVQHGSRHRIEAYAASKRRNQRKFVFFFKKKRGSACVTVTRKNAKNAFLFCFVLFF